MSSTLKKKVIRRIRMSHRLWSLEKEIASFPLREAVKNRSLGGDKERFLFRISEGRNDLGGS